MKNREQYNEQMRQIVEEARLEKELRKEREEEIEEAYLYYGGIQHYSDIQHLEDEGRRKFEEENNIKI